MKNREKTLIIEIKSRVGLHLRPCAAFVQQAEKFKGTIYVINLTTNSKAVKGTNLMGLLALQVKFRDRLKICAIGPCAENVLDKLKETLDHESYA